MATAIAQQLKIGTTGGTYLRIVGMHELVAFCPNCKTLETLSFSNGWLVPTRKFTQRDGLVYHDCGSDQPCRLFRGF